MLKLSKQQYNMYKAELPSVLKVRHILLAETADSQTLLPYLQQTAKTNSGSPTQPGNNTLLQMRV